MSYDVIFWRGAADEDPLEVWHSLYAGEPVEGIRPFTTAEVVAAFRTVFGSQLRVVDDHLEGRRFELVAREGATHLQVTCAWSVADEPEIVTRIHAAGAALGCVPFDPQLAQPRKDIQPKPALAPLTVAPGAFDGLPVVDLTVRSKLAVRPDRVTSFGAVQTCTLTDPSSAPSGFAAIHPLFVEAAREPLTDAKYARIVDDVFPFDVVSGRMHAGNWYRSELLGVHEGRAGFLRAPGRADVKEEGRSATRTTRIVLDRVDLRASPAKRAGNPPTDLSVVVGHVLVRAIGSALAGDLRPLLRAVVLLVSISTQGRPAAQLFDDELPKGLPPFELYELGASIPVWCGRMLECRLVVPDEGGWKLLAIEHDPAPLFEVGHVHAPI